MKNPISNQTSSKRKISLLVEVALLFLLGILATGALTFFVQRIRANANVQEHTENIASRIAGEVSSSVKEYPASNWLIQYWYDHADELSIEYDKDFSDDDVTREKCRVLSERHPELQLKYATEEELVALPKEDQKLYAEITYSWLITEVNQIKRSFEIDFLFCVVTDESYTSQFFLFSAADPGAIRGTSYEDVYILGKTVDVSASQSTGMREAAETSSHLADAGEYVDYYSLLDTFRDKKVLLGMTYKLSGLRADVDAQTLSGTAIAVGYQVLLSLICLLLIFRFVLRPIKKVQENIRAYQETKDSETVAKNLGNIKLHNEIGELSDDVVNMTKEMTDYLENIKTITAEHERISTELSLASRIQEAMLPSDFPAFPERSEFDIYASMTPAREVGGDFYDFFMIDEEHLCMVIADVSGKGVPAALFMMASKIVLASNAMTGKSPAQILTDTNEAICSNNVEQMFLTVWLGILEISTGKLTAANAGHEYPMLKSSDGNFELIKDKHGFVIGGMEGVKYREYELKMTPGSKLFLYTDGVAEATDEKGDLFGVERTLDALNKAADVSPEQILKNIRDAADGFVGEAEQFDDMTMLCLEYKGDKHLEIDKKTDGKE